MSANLDKKLSETLTAMYNKKYDSLKLQQGFTYIILGEEEISELRDFLNELLKQG